MPMYPEIETQSDELPSLPDPGPIAAPNGKRRHQRNQVACDPCHIRRVRCDLVSPLSCSRCLRNGINCEITRKQQKRGRRARSALASTNGTVEAYAWSSRKEERQLEQKRSPVSLPNMSPTSSNTPASVTEPWLPATNEIDTLLASFMEDCRSVTDASQLQAGSGVDVTEGSSSTADLSEDFPEFKAEDDQPLSLLPDIWTSIDIAPHTPSQGAPMILSPPSTNDPGLEHGPVSHPSLKYPVLNTVMPLLETHLRPQLVCHLLELYFTGVSSNQLHTVYRHTLCYILRKSAFLADNFRPTSPALLTSMLWVAAMDDRAFSLSLSSIQQRNICQFLGDLTKTLLRVSEDASPNNQDTSLVGPRCSSTTVHDLMGSAGHLDRVITYIHIASIVSTEQNTASTGWWKAAFDLARQLKLNQETRVVPSFDNQANQSFSRVVSDQPKERHFFHFDGAQPSFNCVCQQIHDRGYPVLTEEHREERRRTWWLLYIIDRHFALCHNRPPDLLDAECENLLLPLEETSWQVGTVHSNSIHSQGPRCVYSEHRNRRPTLPDFRCRDFSLFGFFLPLMTMTGEIMRLNHVQQQGNEAYEVKKAEILRHLEIYQTSLTTAAASSAPLTGGPKGSDQLVDAQQFQDYAWQMQTAVAYSSYLIRVLHILLVGKCDWLFLMEDTEFWTSPAFASTISHVLDAAFWLRQILQLDPDISFMPYFFGIQLFRGSFPVLLIVERLQSKSGEDILNACETIIQATESCLITCNTDYQRKFRQLLRSAVSQAWGRPASPDEIRQRRKAVFALWLWTRRGTSWPADFYIPCQTGSGEGS